MKPHEVYIYSYNEEIISVFSNLKQAYYAMEGRLSPNQKKDLKTYSQVHRDMRKSPLFNLSYGALKLHQIKRYEVEKTYK